MSGSDTSSGQPTSQPPPSLPRHNDTLPSVIQIRNNASTANPQGKIAEKRDTKITEIEVIVFFDFLDFCRFVVP